MKHTFDGTFEKVIPSIPESLIENDVISAISRLNRLLPPDLAFLGGLECLLGSEDRKADWLLGINTIGGGREIFSQCLSREDLPSFFYENENWKAIRKLTAQWTNPNSPLSRYLSFLWLEFDYSTIESGVPVPCIFMTVAEQAEKEVTGAHQYDWLFEETLGCFPDVPITEGVKEKVRFCLESLPEGARTVYAGLMLGRKINGLRLVLSIPPENLEKYLKLIGWQGASEELMELVHSVSRHVEMVDINLDVSDRVHSKVGLECILKKKQLKIEPRWRDLTNFLVERSLCKTEKSQGLLSWPGYELTTLPHEEKPSFIFRGISHIKLVYQTGKPVEAKGYLGFRKIYQSDVEKMIE